MNSLVSLTLRRLGLGFVTLIAISLIVFLGVEALPGDIAQAVLGQSATEETVAAFRRALRLDLPWHERYFEWLWRFLQGDMGESLTSRREISELIGTRLANTIFLALAAATVAVPLSLILGIFAAMFRNTWFDRTSSISTLAMISVPDFFIGYVLIAVFSVYIGGFPSLSNVSNTMSFGERIHAIVLPCMTLTLLVAAHMMRLTRAAIINLLASPYIEMAHLKGIRGARIIVRHALPNALSPIINVVVLNLAYLVVGVVVVEVVFVYPGLGQLLVDSVSKRDIPVVQACSIIFAGAYVLLNLAADLLAIIANPRLRHPK